MRKDDAHALLDAAKSGQPVSRAEIDAALWATGDLKPLPRGRRVRLVPSMLGPAEPAPSTEHDRPLFPNRIVFVPFGGKE